MQSKRDRRDAGPFFTFFTAEPEKRRE